MEEITRSRRGHKHGRHSRGAQTFRRGRAVEFYKMLLSKEETLIQQLERKEFESIQSMLAGELKAVQSIKAEFQATFGISEEDLFQENEEK